MEIQVRLVPEAALFEHVAPAGIVVEVASLDEDGVTGASQFAATIIVHWTIMGYW